MSAFDNFELCRSILESLPVGICVLDAQKKIVFWSDGAERVTGRLRHEVIGRSCISQSLLHCDQPGCEYCGEDCPLARAIKTARPVESLCFIHHKAGHQLLVRSRAVPVHNAHGSIVGAAAVFDEQSDALTTGGPRESNCRPSGVDGITGVANHETTRSRLREALTVFDETHVGFGVLCFRIEQFDRFRASYGSEAASSLLRVFARTLENSLCRTDVIGRWSDEEFLVILNGYPENALQSITQRLRRLLADDSIGWWGERRSLAFTIGQASAQRNDTIESILKRAHASLAESSVSAARAGAAGSSTAGS
ncbi:MAG TPA: diguanylate cyclase [Verrucomicrobiae bacterium]|jgi:diguanylate cyclase (GGDEF)-like protein/PAS domain S-box-containing protein|nr:diguanylate cyclase [Verrucomicrobiae bacterium]